MLGNSTGPSPLDALKTASSDPYETVRCLLATGAQLDDKSAVRLITKGFTHNWSRRLVLDIKAWKPNTSTLHARVQSVFLCAATSVGDLNVLGELLKLGIADADCEIPEKAALIAAAENGHFDALELLVPHVSKFNFLNEDGRTAFHICVRQRDEAGARHILEKTDLINIMDNSVQTPLLDAVRYQSLSIVSRLLQRISTLDSLSHVLPTALEIAIKLNRPERVALLLERKDVIKTAMRTSTLLFQAIGVGYPNVAELLINAEIFPDEKHTSGYTPLLYAAEEGLVDIVQSLINPGAVDIEAESWYQETALMLAVINNHPPVAQTLLSAGASTNRQIMPSRVNRKRYDPQNVPHHAYSLSSASRPGPSGDTLLLHAASRGYSEIVKPLIPYLNVNANQAWSPSKQAALHVAVINEHVDILRTLLNSKKVNVSIRDGHGRTAFQVAYGPGHRKNIPKDILDRLFVR
ncbi:ankyrin repeat-containing domain protein [Aspergillus venezuelensis]